MRPLPSEPTVWAKPETAALTAVAGSPVARPFSAPVTVEVTPPRMPEAVLVTVVAGVGGGAPPPPPPPGALPPPAPPRAGPPPGPAPPSGPALHRPPAGGAPGPPARLSGGGSVG